MKNPTVAFALNFILAGAGFLYLKRWKLAALNLGGAVALGIVLALLLPASVLDGLGSFLPFVIGGASGGWAQYTAVQMNEEAARRAAEEPTLEGVGEEARLS